MGEILLAAVLLASFTALVAMEFTKRRIVRRAAPLEPPPKGRHEDTCRSGRSEHKAQKWEVTGGAVTSTGKSFELVS